ncbi:hypothetical protein AB0J57_26940 [Streptomyces sp. NPDC049837]|uniref:hypothetical protein n=1 Tax=Streptomyces sp. NPDC049837 TaxID=3155277 RepID=UPI003442F239
MLIEHYESIGLTSLVDDPGVMSHAVGWFEIGLGALVLAPVPLTGLLLAVCGWKIATEMLYVTSGARGAVFEVIERASAYAAPLALICVMAAVTGAAHGRRSGDGAADAATPARVPVGSGPGQ